METKQWLSKPMLFFTIAILIVLMAVVVILYTVYNENGALPLTTVECQNDTECFISRAAICKSAKAEITKESITIRYESSDNCTLNKTIIFVNAQEPQELRQLLEGKTLECEYTRGEFNQQWVHNLTLGIEKCTGSLKYAIQSLQQAYEKRFQEAVNSTEIREDVFADIAEINESEG